MNNALLGLAIALILGIFSLLVAPFLINWNSYKPQLESYVGVALGADVLVEGDVELSILPRPSLKASKVSLLNRGALGGALEIERLDMQLQLGALLKGEIAVEALVLDQPYVSVVRAANGQLSLPPALNRLLLKPSAGKAALEAAKVSVSEGRLQFHDLPSGRKLELQNLNLNLSLDSAAGPLRIEGGGVMDGERYALRFSALRDGDTGIRTSFMAEAASRPFGFRLDGLFHSETKPLRFDGLIAMHSDGAQGRIYALESTASISEKALMLDDVSLAVGSQGQGFDLTGKGEVGFDDLRLTLDLTGTQLVLGNSEAGKARQGQSLLPKTVVSALSSLPIPVDFTLTAEGLLLGSQLFNDIELSGSLGAKLWRIQNAKATMRGDGKLAYSGSVTPLSDGFLIDGRVRVSALRPINLQPLFWRAPKLYAKLRPLAKGPILFETSMAYSNQGVRLNALSLEAGKTSLKGDLWLKTEAEKVTLDRSSLIVDGFDLASLKSTGFQAATLFDVLAHDNARINLRLQNTLYNGGAFGALAINLSQNQGILRLEELSLQDPYGGNLALTGDVVREAEQVDAAVQGSLSTDNPALMLKGLAPLLPENAQHWLESFARNSGATDMQLDMSVSQNKGELASMSIVAAGEAVGTTFSIEGSLDLGGGATEPTNMVMQAKNENASVLLRQMGVEDSRALSQAKGEGSVNLQIDGKGSEKSEDASTFDLQVQLPASELSANGTLTRISANGFEFADMVFVHQGALAPVMAMVRLPVLDFSVSSLSGMAARNETAFSVQFDGANGAKNAAGLRGELRFATGQAEASQLISGALQLESLTLAKVTQSLTGQHWRLEDGWNEQRFEVALPEGVLGNVDVTIGTLELSGEQAIRDLEGKLGFEATGLRFDVKTAELFGGSLAGTGQMLRQPEGVSLSGQGQLSGADLSTFVWRNEGRPLAMGAADFGLRFEGLGQSPAGLVGALSGQGTLGLADVTVRKLNTGAFKSITRASQSGIELTDARVREVFAGYLATGDFKAQGLDMALALSSGQLRIDNARLERSDERFRLAATLDLQTLLLNADLSIRSEGDLVASGTAPEVTLVFSGPVSAPERRLDVSALTGYLTVLALDREVERIETLQADILEREKFNRILRVQALERLKQRLAREAAEAAEAARLKALEQDRKAKEAAEAAKALQEEITIGFPPGFNPPSGSAEPVSPPIDLGAPRPLAPPQLPQSAN